jgi:hypothetical protein
MILDQATIEVLMTWARAHAPLSGLVVNGHRQRRRMRIEINSSHYDAGIWCRAYLAHPCDEKDHRCLAETRIG